MAASVDNRPLSEDSVAFRLAKLGVAFLLFSSFLMFFLNIDLWDYDFWWHVATGKYIVSHGHLPDKDPFSFPSGLAENDNPFPRWEHFVLQQNPLSQPIFYQVFDHAGSKGIIILRSLVLVLTLLTVYWRIIRSGTSFILSIAFTILLFVVFSSASGERPVLFSYFFTALLLSLLEDFRYKGDGRIYWIIPLMLVWANMHGGFIIGDITLLVYMVGEAVNMARGRSGLARQQGRMFYVAAGVAVLASFVNPSGWDAFIVSFLPKYKILFERVQEWQSPFYFLVNKIWGTGDYRFYSYAALVLIFPVILLARNRSLDLTHVLLLTGMVCMAASSLRLFTFYAVSFTILMAKEFDILVSHLIRKKWTESALQKTEWGIACVTALSIIIFMLGMAKEKSFGFGVATQDSVPKGAADFIENSKIAGNMLNDYNYGGYLLWRLYPWKQNFIDGRTVNIKALKDYEVMITAADFYGAIKKNLSGRSPLWQMLLNHYRINLVVISPFDSNGDVVPLTLRLLESDAWVPVYCDPLSLIFVRNTDLNRSLADRHRLGREVVYNAMVASATAGAMRHKVNPRYLISVGKIFYAMGRKEDALKAYKYALKRDHSREIEDKIREVESEISISPAAR